MIRRLATILIVSLIWGWVGPGNADAASQVQAPEDEVRAALGRFQKGVEAGDIALGTELSAQAFAASFVPFYNMLADVYSRNRLAFPVKIGHVKVLRDGRAKAEVRLNPNEDLFVFTLVMEGGQWKFSHMEGILFPVFDVPAVPASSVLDLPRDRVQWMICEKDTAFLNEVYFKLKESLGSEAAHNFLVKRGQGFRAALDAWLPFIEGAAQFAVFYGILEENYYGSKYTLVSANEAEAQIRFDPLQEMEVMAIASFTPKLGPEEYQALYRDIMTERARACGLDLKVEFDGIACTLKIKKRSATGHQ